MTTGILQPGEDTILAVRITSTMTPIAQVVEVDGPAVNVEAVDATTLTGGIIVTRPSRFPEPDKMTIKLFFDPNDTITQALFVTDVTTPKAVEAFQLTFNDANTTHATATFSGFITSFKLNGMKVKTNLGADIEIQLTTLITFIPGTP